MVWIFVCAVIALVGGLGILVNVNRLRCERRVASEMRALVAALPSSVPRADLGDLPPPVARYRRLAVGERAPVRTLRIPTALFDARTVTWSAIDADHARATLRLGDREVSGDFEFGPDGMPLRMTAERFTDKGELRPWGGVYRDFRSVSGMRVPFEADVTWQLETGPFTYARWLVDSMEYDGEPASDAR